MLSKRIVAVARRRALSARIHSQNTATPLSKAWSVQSHVSHCKHSSAEVVKVPQMAESISEGTLKSWSKKVGDAVEADEEVATIETDKIDVTVNAPVSGTIVELLANEEDTCQAGAARTKPSESPEELPPSSKKGDSEEPVDQQVDKQGGGARMRLRIAERLKESQNAAASLTTFNEIDMSALMDMRKKYKDEVAEGSMTAFARACTLALQELPAVNASIEGDEIVYRDFVDLSVAVATPKGLAKDGKLSLEDMTGGTFTISNGGVFGSLFGTPIINLPQSAVLGMHTIKERPVVVNGQIVIRPYHDLKVKEYIEDPRKMLLAPF
ncbi:hypothetical protein BKA83DRAFT_4220720 [Pisolithus microcarpus]|nr:hypothetical protein BKA83DRAFT_4220720 [Pisolithus microcarpus]